MKLAPVFFLLFSAFVVAGCTAVDPRARANEQMETGHVDSGGAGEGSM